MEAVEKFSDGFDDFEVAKFHAVEHVVAENEDCDSELAAWVAGGL